MTAHRTVHAYEQDDGTLVIYRCPEESCGSVGPRGSFCGHDRPPSNPTWRGLERKPVWVPGVGEEPRYTLEQVRDLLLGDEVIDAGLLALPDLSRRWWNELPGEEREHLRRELRAQISAALDHLTPQPAGVGAEEECLTCGSEASDST